MRFIRLGMSGVAMWTALIAGVANTGCASGGWKLTRQYAGFVNKQQLIIRIILYILTMVVFAVTMIIDAVIFNTMDFWKGRVSQGTYEFNKDGRQYVAKHSYQDGGMLRQSHIEIFAEGKKLQDVILKELSGGKIDVIVDGVVKAQVDNIDSAPNLSYFSPDGQRTHKAPMFVESLVAGP